jgi:hypothetical protein
LLGAVVYACDAERGHVQCKSWKDEFGTKVIRAETAFEVAAPDLIVVVDHGYEFVA